MGAAMRCNGGPGGAVRVRKRIPWSEGLRLVISGTRLRNEAQSIKLDAGKFIAQNSTKRGREPRNRDGQRFGGGGPAWAGADGTFTLTLGGSGCFQLRKLGSKRRPARRCFEGWLIWMLRSTATQPGRIEIAA
jgi:hypothetical protein